MRNSIKKELTEYIYDCTNDFNGEISFFNMFSTDYYLIGYHQCSEWLKTHDLDVFEAIEIINTYNVDNFGDINREKTENSKALVNMLVYIYGKELCKELDIPFEL